MICEVRSKSGQDYPIKALDLTIRLQMVGRSEGVVDCQDVTDVLKEPVCELTPVICDTFGRRTVSETPVVDEGLGDRRSGDASKVYGSD